uniref:Uncharacterized protein n=1 Tax=Anguilla anguilla TaxID=7936 RepID=A0A0E9X2P8_ANGAN
MKGFDKSAACLKVAAQRKWLGRRLLHLSMFYFYEQSVTVVKAGHSLNCIAADLSIPGNFSRSEENLIRSAVALCV